MKREIVNRCFLEHQQTLAATELQLSEKIAAAYELVCKTIKAGNTIFLCGNGGSAADAQHIAAEFTGRFVKERAGLPAIALTTDSSALTAIGNDYGFARIFSRQLEALAKPGDLLIAISTSGNSENIVMAIHKAKEKSLSVIGLSGRDGGQMNELCDCNIVIPSNTTARIQEMHILIGHIFCTCIDEDF
jgi:D-sedoheptulose 7-phosphate isomerase